MANLSKYVHRLQRIRVGGALPLIGLVHSPMEKETESGPRVCAAICEGFRGRGAVKFPHYILLSRSGGAVTYCFVVGRTIISDTRAVGENLHMKGKRKIRACAHP
jgi:hypothetical protein